MDIALTDQDALMQIPVGPVYFQKKLGTNDRIIEEGLCGRTTVFSDELREGRRGLDTIGILLESHAPVNLLILMLGTNDCKTRYNASAGTIAKGLEQVITKAQKKFFPPFSSFRDLTDPPCSGCRRSWI